MIHVGFETIIGIALVLFALYKTDRKDMTTLLIGFAGVALAILGRHACGWQATTFAPLLTLRFKRSVMNEGRKTLVFKA